MTIVKVETFVQAPIEICFDAARDIDLHTKTVWKHTKEQAIRGTTSGLIGFNETVTFKATHLGVRQTLTSKIVAYERPYMFVDEMQKGAFKHLRHIHEFVEVEGGTNLVDTLDFSAPYGIVGRWFEKIVLEDYMKRFIVHRNEQLKKIIEQENPGPR